MAIPHKPNQLTVRVTHNVFLHKSSAVMSSTPGSVTERRAHCLQEVSELRRQRIPLGVATWCTAINKGHPARLWLDHIGVWWVSVAGNTPAATVSAKNRALPHPHCASRPKLSPLHVVGLQRSWELQGQENHQHTRQGLQHGTCLQRSLKHQGQQSQRRAGMRRVCGVGLEKVPGLR